MRLRDKIRLARFANRLLNGLPDIDIMKEKLASRKLWAAVVGAALATLGNHLGLSPDIVQTAVTVIMTYIGGQSIVDAVAASRK